MPRIPDNKDDVSCPVLSCPVVCSPVLCCPVLSCPVLSCPLLVRHLLSCVVLLLSLSLLLLSACLFPHKEVGSYVNACPRPCPSTYRWARLATHRRIGLHCVLSVLSYPLWPCDHRMCVIAKETGLSS